jgi:ribonuclease P protein component
MSGMRLRTLKHSAEFKRIRGGARWGTEAFLLEGKQRVSHPVEAGAGGKSQSGIPDDCAEPSGPRFGFTITKKLGGAVARNRMRRRLKAVVRGLDPGLARNDFDYVVVARAGALDQPYETLVAGFRTALEHIGRHPHRAREPSPEGQRGKARQGKDRRDRSTTGTPARAQDEAR